MFVLMDCETIWANCARVSRVSDGSRYCIWLERGGVVVERVRARELTLYDTGEGIEAVGNDTGELAIEGLSDVAVASEDFVIEEDGLA